MKCIYDNDTLTIIAEEGETAIPCLSWQLTGINHRTTINRVVVPDGITELKNYAFSSYNFNEVVLPKSITKMGIDIFHDYHDITVYYAGTSEEFLAIDHEYQEEVYERGEWDKYPYYNDTGSCWKTQYYSFDRKAQSVRVICTDGYALLYGKRHRYQNAKPTRVAV